MLNRPLGIVAAKRPALSVSVVGNAIAAILGAEAKAHWTADSGITESAGSVSAWADAINGITLSQGTGSLQPAYSATGWNGSAAAVTFDGADYMDHAGMPSGFPVVGTDGCIIWVVFELLNDASSDTTTRGLLGFGGTANGTYYGVRRSVVSSINRVNGSNGSSHTSGAPDSSGRKAGRFLFDKVSGGSDIITTHINGAAASSQISNATLSAGSTRMRVGNFPGVTVNGPNVRFRDIIIASDAVTSGQIADVDSYLSGRL